MEKNAGTFSEMMMENRTTPALITSLKDNEIFVFGSNTSGRHGKGAAKIAMKWGAKYGQGSGLQGRTYGIPTKAADVRETLPLPIIGRHVNDFLLYAMARPNNIYLVTMIGCGLAGLKPKQIAPMFKGAIEIENIWLPELFWRVLLKPNL